MNSFVGCAAQQRHQLLQAPATNVVSYQPANEKAAPHGVAFSHLGIRADLHAASATRTRWASCTRRWNSPPDLFPSVLLQCYSAPSDWGGRQVKGDCRTP